MLIARVMFIEKDEQFRWLFFNNIIAYSRQKHIVCLLSKSQPPPPTVDFVFLIYC